MNKERETTKMQACIKRFFEPNQPFGASGNCSKAGPAMSSRLDLGTSPPVGGKVGDVRNEERKGSIGSWERRTKIMEGVSRLLSDTMTGGEQKDVCSLRLQDGEEELHRLKGNLDRE